MPLLVLGLLIFLGVHAASIAAPRWRAAWIAAHGEGAWKGLYSVVAAVGLALVVVGYGWARRDPTVP